jgi:UDP-N-acetylglucosamine enolpyruvyl transferase
MSMAAVAHGTSTLVETIFENRFLHAAELARLGAHIEATGNTATIVGVPSLTGAAVMASDLRASAALVLAGLAASGRTEVLRIYHLDRGYDDLAGRLRTVGARIARVPDHLHDDDALTRALDGEAA